MNRENLERLILDNYNAKPEYPWLKYPRYAVFRHKSNQKWFALIMDVSKSKLGLPETEILDVVNFKCSPLLIGSLLDKKGFFPAYHMSKDNWITVALDGSVSDEQIKSLLDWSYEMTAPKIRKK
ncbi:MAG: MmcQ/YjbR family DNA-binding protein [Abditibacteriota bacterium]|nr:MmcQ/YjbR family DNA-binding protein [Abditibacteriota bacterium]